MRCYVGKKAGWLEQNAVMFLQSCYLRTPFCFDYMVPLREVYLEKVSLS